MRFVVEAAVDRDPVELEGILHRRGAPGGVVTDPWARGIQCSGDGDMITVERVLRAAAEWACAEAELISLRIQGEEVDLLYSLPCDDFEAALRALPADVDSFREKRDEWSRNWFRGRWMGMEEEARLMEDEIGAGPLTPERILDLFDPLGHRDRRSVHTYVERRATCADLVRAMQLATTTTQRRRLAHLFTLRPRPCAAAVPYLVRWLEDPDDHVALDSADGLGLLLASTTSPQCLAAAQKAAGPPLFRYARAHPAPYVLTALGVTAYPPARAYLEHLSTGAGRTHLREYAARALRTFDWYASPHNAGKAPPSGTG